jgi:hypothetical protein
MVVFNTGHIGYEFMPNNDLYIGVDTLVTEMYNTTTKRSAVPASLEVRFGRSYFLDGQHHIRPILGGGIARDLKVVDFLDYSNEFHQWVKLDELKHPTLAYGFLGVMLEHEFNSRLALGLNVKALIGGVVGKCDRQQREYFNVKSIYYAGDISLPFTIRMGSARNWDLRLEPFALVMNDGNRYIGHRSAIAYRF